jgi:hypothetical protein
MPVWPSSMLYDRVNTIMMPMRLSIVSAAPDVNT